MSRLITSVFLMGFCIGSLGCASYALQPPYVNIVDQFYMTRGASEALLGSYGIVDTLGFDSFERIGYRPELVKDSLHRRTWIKCRSHDVFGVKGELEDDWMRSKKLYAASIKVDYNDVRSRSVILDVIDIDKEKLVAKLNTTRYLELKKELRQSSRYRIVTAAVYVVEYNDVEDRRLDANAVAKSAAGKGGALAVKWRKDRTEIIGTGTVYAYQMSHIEWDNNRWRIVGLKTDRPIFADELTRGYTIHCKTVAGDGKRRDSSKKCKKKLEKFKAKTAPCP